MPQTGSGTMTPVTGGVPGAWTDVLPYPYTLLSIYRYARIMGITPLHFAGASTPGLSPQVMPIEGCGGFWAKYDWQIHDQVSKMQLAEAIYQAEYEISQALGYWPAPKWTSEETQIYPGPFARAYGGIGLDVASKPKSLRTNYGYIISGGRRAITLVGVAAPVYTDEDSDGYFETATITIATALTNIQEIKLYYTGHNGELEWEIRPIRSKRISGGNAIFIVDAWELIKPDLYEVFPTQDGFDAIDITTVGNYETAVDVYQEYNTTALASSQFIWENDLIGICATCGGTGCEDCTPATQDGCLTIRKYEAGIVTPFPAEYDGGWTATTWTECREPENVKLWYYSGLVANDYVQNRSYDPLSLEFAKAIAWLATARLDRPLCGCGNLEAITKELQTDVTLRETKGNAYFITPDGMTSPFGTKIGEIKAWRIMSKLAKRRLGVAVI